MAIIKNVNFKKMEIISRGINIQCSTGLELVTRLTKVLVTFDGSNIEKLTVRYGFKDFEIIHNYQFDAKQHLLLFRYLNGDIDPEIEYVINDVMVVEKTIKQLDIDYDKIEKFNNGLVLVNDPWSDMFISVDEIKTDSVGFYIDIGGCDGILRRFYTNRVETTPKYLLVTTDQYDGCTDGKRISWQEIDKISIKNYK